MFEILHTTTAKKAKNAFLGEVSSAALTTGAAVAAAIGLISGTDIAGGSTGGWLKFSYNGKIIYISKKILRHTVSWNQIYAAGAVYGDDTNGKVPGPTPKLQNAKIVIGGVTHRVRLLRSLDPVPPDTIGLELKDLLLNVLAEGSGGTGAFATYTSGDLGLSIGSWVLDANSNNLANRYIMEVTTNTPTRVVLTGSLPATSSYNFMGWRPVLEVM